jgi:hypothetical protein
MWRRIYDEGPGAAKPQPNRIISRKGAKGAKRKRIFTLRAWRLGAIKRVSMGGKE